MISHRLPPRSHDLTQGFTPIVNAQSPQLPRRNQGQGSLRRDGVVSQHRRSRRVLAHVRVVDTPPKVELSDLFEVVGSFGVTRAVRITTRERSNGPSCVLNE